MSAVAVVLATRDRPAMVAEAIEGIVRALRPGDELIVVDSASRDPQVGRVLAASGARHIRLELPGLSRARNAGWRAATAPIVAFTDDDCLVSSAWIAGIGGAFEDASVAFVTGRVVGDRDAAIGTATVVAEEPKIFRGVQDPATFGSGANMALRRSALDQLGGFDERLGSGTSLGSAEDHDIFVRALAAGWTGRFEPSIEVTHRLWRRKVRAVSREYAYGLGAGALAWKMKRTAGVALLGKRLWDEGIAQSARNVRRGYESGAVAALMKAAGVAVGYARASLMGLEDGRLRSRRSSRARRRGSAG